MRRASPWFSKGHIFQEVIIQIVAKAQVIQELATNGIPHILLVFPGLLSPGRRRHLHCKPGPATVDQLCLQRSDLPLQSWQSHGYKPSSEQTLG